MHGLHFRGASRALAGIAVMALSGLAGAADPPPVGNPAGAAPDTPGIYDAHPNPQHANTDDALFVREAALSGAAEVDVGKLAAHKAHSPAVKDFATVMVEDHGKANKQLATAASADGLALDSKPDMDHQVILDQLNKADVGSFDVLYIRGQVMEHQKAAQLYEWIIDNGQDPRLTRYAMDTLPIVLHHLEMAKVIQAQLTGSAP
jgi:putative membrane protein